MGVTSVMEEDGGVSPITVKNTAVTTALSFMMGVRSYLRDDIHNS